VHDVATIEPTIAAAGADGGVLVLSDFFNALNSATTIALAAKYIGSPQSIMPDYFPRTAA
jgi:hypothetical protein